MGAKTWMIVWSDGNAADILRNHPILDEEKTTDILRYIFSNQIKGISGQGDLSMTCPPDNEIHAGHFGNLVVIAAKEFGIDYPSKLSKEIITAFPKGQLALVAMHSVVDWSAFAVWKNGTLVRSISVNPDQGMLENIGDPLEFERPYLNGEHRVDDEYPLAFHPLDYGNEVLLRLFGYQIEGNIHDCLFEPESIPLIVYKRKNASWWKVW